MYCSHAGKPFSVQISGKWWDTISREEMKTCFEGDNAKEYDRILPEDFRTEEFRDRRQEIIFIGASIDEAAITEALDKCLVTVTKNTEGKVMIIVSAHHQNLIVE